MLIKTVSFLNINILSISKNHLLAALDKGVLITPNLDHLVKLQEDGEFYDAYKKAEWIICDSKILYLLSKLLKVSIVEAIPGSSFFSSYYNYHKNNVDCRIFLLGAAPGIAHQAMIKINEKVERSIVVATHSPSYGFEKNEEECQQIIQMINNSNATVLVVGVGAPKQEKWIAKYRDSMPGISLFMGLGATIDFEAGTLERAPAIWQTIGMEWFFRFIKEPRRLFRRYFVDDVKFFYYFSKQLFGKYRNPYEK